MANAEHDFSLLNGERERLLALINFQRNISQARGNYLYTDRGEALLDFTSQFGAVPFGHNPEFLWQELQAQAQQAPGVMIQPFSSAGAQSLAAKLSELAPGNLGHVTLGCTGAEVVEMAIKLARARTGRQGILSALNSFHGKTLGASFATGNAYYREPFHRPSADFAYVPFDDLDALRRSLSSREFAAFIVEPVQGEGGMIVPAPGYLKACEQLCREFGTLLVVDEVQTGLGRTGTLFACEAQGVEPDILLLAKALGGGLLPISACLANARAWSREFGERHSSTFANNHLGARLGVRVLEKLLEHDGALLGQVRAQGQYLSHQLAALVKRHPAAFRANSGLGLMQGLVLTDWRDEDSYLTNVASEEGYAVALVAGYLLNRHQIFTAPALNASQVLRIQPSYLITRAEIDRLVVALDDVGRLLSVGNYVEIFRSAVGLPAQPRRVNTYKNAEPVPNGGKLGTFAFFIHPMCDADLLECIPGGPQAYAPGEIASIERWIGRLKDTSSQAAAAYYIPSVPSRQGGYVDGWLISSFLSPGEMMRLKPADKQALLQSYVAVAREKGATVMGLGAFTSIISRAGRAIGHSDIPVTTGNAFTALTSTDSLRKLCHLRGQVLAQLHLGVVGAGGSVGRLATLDLAPDCGAVTLIGRGEASLPALEALAGELLERVLVRREPSPLLDKLANLDLQQPPLTAAESEPGDAAARRLFYHRIRRLFETRAGSGERFPVELSTDVRAALGRCQLVLTATSQGQAFIQPEMLAAGALVCDVARPSDLTQDVLTARPDLLAYEGGLVTLPAPVRFGGANVVGLDTGLSLACLAETIILTMSQVERHYSLGGSSSLDEARQVFAWGQQHGFSTRLPSALNDAGVCRTPSVYATV